MKHIQSSLKNSVSLSVIFALMVNYLFGISGFFVSVFKKELSMQHIHLSLKRTTAIIVVFSLLIQSVSSAWATPFLEKEASWESSTARLTSKQRSQLKEKALRLQVQTISSECIFMMMTTRKKPKNILHSLLRQGIQTLITALEN